MVGPAQKRLCLPYNAKPSIIRMLFKSSRCAPNPPRTSLIADLGEASNNAAVRRKRQRRRRLARPDLMTHFAPALPSAGAAMQRYS